MKSGDNMIPLSDLRGVYTPSLYVRQKREASISHPLFPFQHHSRLVGGLRDQRIAIASAAIVSTYTVIVLHLEYTVEQCAIVKAARTVKSLTRKEEQQL